MDEAEGQATIKVAQGVTFIATANIGNEYTSTRVMDRALMDRFINIEMDVLTKEEEEALLLQLYPHVDADTLKHIAELSSITRIESAGDEGKLTTHISTRASVQTADLLHDGFSLDEAAQVSILPRFDASGGLESERTYVKQILQKYTGDSGEELYSNLEDEANA